MAGFPSTTGCPGSMLTASSDQYEMIFSTSFPALARSAHSASRCISFADSAVASKVAGVDGVQATSRRGTAEREGQRIIEFVPNVCLLKRRMVERLDTDRKGERITESREGSRPGKDSRHSRRDMRREPGIRRGAPPVTSAT